MNEEDDIKKGRTEPRMEKWFRYFHESANAFLALGGEITGYMRNSDIMENYLKDRKPLLEAQKVEFAGTGSNVKVLLTDARCYPGCHVF